MQYRWSEERDRQLRDLVAQGLKWADIGDKMGLHRESVSRRWARITEDEAGKAARLEKRRKNMALLRERDRRIIQPDDFIVTNRIIVPPDVLIEREARLSAPVSLTGRLLGDPPAGFSALDRKQAGAGA